MNLNFGKNIFLQMKNNLFFITAIAALLAFSCGSKSDGGETGTIYYYSVLEKMDGMKVNDGGDVILTAVLQKKLPDSSKQIAINGKTLYLVFDKQEIIKKGARYKLPNPDFELFIAEWYGKDSFNLNPNVQGTVFVREHQEYQKTVLDVDLKVRTGFSDYWYFNGSKTFTCIRHYKNFKGEPIVSDSVDIQFDAKNLSALRLDGKWLKSGELFLDTHYNRWMEMFFLPEKVEWTIQSGLMVSPKVEEFKVDNGRIFIKDQAGSKEYLINSFKNDSLVITNQLSPAKNRYIFERKAQK